MTRRLEIAPRALADAQRAAAWHEERRPGHGYRLRRELDRVLRLILEHPESYQSINARFRRAFLHRFPFVVIYHTAPAVIRIVGVLPTHGDPIAIADLSQQDPC